MLDKDVRLGLGFSRSKILLFLLLFFLLQIQIPNPNSKSNGPNQETQARRKRRRRLSATDSDQSIPKLTPDDVRKIAERFSQDQLLEILTTAAARHVEVLHAVRSIADPDTTKRKLFIRGLGWDTTTEKLRNLFSAYGELEEAVVILDKTTGKSKGYGFVTFKHVDGALLALKEPSKKIDGRVTVTQLAAAGTSANNSNPVDVNLRKIYVGNIPYEMTADKLLSHFLAYGEIEEGPLGFDKNTGQCRGFALFVYKTVEGAQAALENPTKTIDGRQLECKLALPSDGKKGKQGGPPGQGDGIQGPVGGGSGNDGMGLAPPNSIPGSQYGGPGGIGSYGGFPGGPPPLGHHGPGLNSQAGAAASLGGAGGYGGAGLGGPYGGYGGPASTGYGGIGVTGGAGGGSSLYRLPPSSVGMASGGYPDSGHYSLSTTGSGYPSQHHQPTGTSPVPRVPPGAGMYPNVPHYF